jgi:hypothetical protein
MAVRFGASTRSAFKAGPTKDKVLQPMREPFVASTAPGDVQS